MHRIIKLIFALSAMTLYGCAATQTVSQFESKAPATICIAEHEAVLRDNFQGALVDAFESHGAKTKIIRATYEEKDSMWLPQIYPDEVAGCDAVAFYVANWAWDLAMYMYFASIWVTDVEMTEKIAQATYQTGGSMGKYINAREKVFELVDQMYKDYNSSKQ
jgi:hypothetical protein